MLAQCFGDCLLGMVHNGSKSKQNMIDNTNRPMAQLSMNTSTLRMIGSLKRHWLKASLACLISAASVGNAPAQIVAVVDSFPDAASVDIFGYQDWNGSTNGALSWAAGPTYDANGSASSGSMKLEVGLTTTNNGGAFLDYFASTDYSMYANLEFDIKVDPASWLDKYGAAIELKPGVQTTSAYNYNAADMNIYPVTTNNGWQHIILPKSTIGGPQWNQIVDIFFQTQDYNETNTTPETSIFYIDNIKFTAQGATYPDYTNITFQFDSSNDVFAIYGASNAVSDLNLPWYGSTNFVAWSTNDSHGNTNSGSLYLSCQFTNGNNCIVAIPFDTNETQYGLETNAADIIDARHYSAVELDVLWDTNNSTIEIDAFNAAGDVDGFPIGALENSPIPNPTGGGGQAEICGSKTTYIPDAASNSWQHIVCPITSASITDSQMIGLWFKKYFGDSQASNYTAAFWVDNITFDGALIPTHPNQATLSISKPVPGLQCNFSGTAGNAEYDRETICTDSDTYSFVDASGPVTYSLTIAYDPGTNSYAEIMFDPNIDATSGTATEPDWVEETLFKITMTATNYEGGEGTFVELCCKTNISDSNGELYNMNDPKWTNASPLVGTWTFTISNNTNILCQAPNGASTNLPFPLGFKSSDVEANFPPANGMFIYFGAQGNGSASEGTRWVFSNFSISGGGVTPLSEDWVAEANTGSSANGGEAGPAGSGGTALSGQNQPWTGSVSGVQWLDTSDSSTPRGLYLIGTNTQYFIDWTSVAGGGLNVLTNATLDPSGWGTNSTLTANAYLDANFYRTEVDETNLPSGGDLFFGLDN
jgi:hypothetical protein